MKKKAIIFARVSTARQERDGLSLQQIQLPKARDYAERNNLEVVEEVAISETGGQYKERKKFKELIKRLKKDKTITDIISFRVDRLTRNFYDAVEIDELRVKYDKRIHLIDNNLVLSKDSKKNDILQWDMNVMMARQYLEGVREDGINTKRNKLERGELPWHAPYGYQLMKVEGRKASIAVPKEPEATIVREIHRRYSSGTYSCQSLSKEINKEYGTRISKSRIHDLLTDKFYIGYILDRKANKEYPHIYERLISEVLFETNQNILNGHSTQRRRYDGVECTYRGLITCADCGCSITPDPKIKQQKNGNVHHYMYYHCTNGKREHSGTVACINEKCIDEAVMNILKGLQVPKEKYEELTQTLKGTHEAKNAFYDGQRKEIVAQREKLERRKRNAYDLMLDGSITPDDYAENNERYETELKQLRIREERLDETDQKFYITARYLLLLFEHAADFFAVAKVEEKREILGLVLSNLQLKGRDLIFTLKKPFDTLINAPEGSLWLGLQDSNLRMTGPKPVALPLGEGPIPYTFCQWCPRLDLNQHALRHMLLRHTCIPISPHGHTIIIAQIGLSYK